MSQSRDQYFDTLGLGADRSSDKAKATLARAYELRDFEIEHYWKRATYFWGFQLAIFAGFGLLWKSEFGDSEWNPITVALAGLGVLTSLANAISAHGSKFWQNNWEKHIDYLEDEIEGRLYKTVWLDKGRRSFSVSGVNRSLSWCIFGFWVFVGLYVAWRFVGSPYPDWLRCFPGRWAGLFVLSALVMLGAVWLLAQKSHFDASEPNSDGSHGAPVGSRYRPAKFIRRYAPDEPRAD